MLKTNHFGETVCVDEEPAGRHFEIETATVEISKLTLGHKYQRELSLMRAKRVAREFLDWKVNIPTVAPDRNNPGTYLVCDGQHTVMALRQLGYTTVTVVIKRHDVSPSLLFLSQNTDCVKPQKWERHRAAFMAGEPMAVAIHDELARYGVGIRGCPGVYDFRIESLMMLENAYQWKILPVFVDAMAELWVDNPHPDNWHSGIQYAMGRFIHVYEKHPAFNWPNLRRMCKQISTRFTPQQLTDLVGNNSGGGGNFASGKEYRAINLFVSMFNKHLRRHRLPDWFPKMRFDTNGEIV